MKVVLNGEDKKVLAITRNITNMCKNLGVTIEEYKEIEKTPKKNDKTEKKEVKHIEKPLQD